MKEVRKRCKDIDKMTSYFESIKSDVEHLFRREKFDNLSILIQNQLSMIKRLPELHSSNLEKYHLSFKEHLRKVLELGSQVLNKSKFVEFLQDKIDKKEIEIRKIQYNHDSELVQFQKNSLEGVRLLERKIINYEKRDMQSREIVKNMRKELRSAKEGESQLLQSINSQIGSLLSHQNTQAKRLENENQLLFPFYQYPEEHKKLRGIMEEFVRDLRYDFENNSSEIKQSFEAVSKQLESTIAVEHNLRELNKKERKIVKDELNSATTIIKSVKEALKKDKIPFSSLLKDLTVIREDFEALLNSNMGELKDQIARYKKLADSS